MHDARQRVVGRGSGDPHLQHAQAVDRPGEHFVTGSNLDRHRFAGDRGDIQGGAPGTNDAVGGQAFARFNDHLVTTCNSVEATMVSVPSRRTVA